MAGEKAPGARVAATSTHPERGALVLVALILVAAVANLNLSVANVALPSIDIAFSASQTQLNLVAVSYSLGLAASVLYLGALGDRYGRKMMLLGGVVLSIPACILAATASSIGALIAARLLGGLAAGMAYPTTLALIAALWSGPARTKSIALWSGLGGAISALGPLLAGLALEHFYWGSVFLLTLPLAAVALVLAVSFVPSHVNETTDPVDNLGGILSILLVASLVMAINLAPVPNKGALALGLAAIAVVAGAAFFLQQRRAGTGGGGRAGAGTGGGGRAGAGTGGGGKVPLYDLQVAKRRVFWVAAVAGIIVFGALMGAIFVGQQFMQDVLGYSTLEAGSSVLPAVLAMVFAAPISAKMVNARGARVTLLAGYLFCLLGFLTMLLLWKQGAVRWEIWLGYLFVGIGIGLAGTPAGRALTSSVPVHRAGMASGTADLQRDLGGAIMQSILGALLTAGYASSVSKTIAGAPPATKSLITDEIAGELQRSFGGAAELAKQYPQYQNQIIAAARSSFVSGSDWAYAVGIIAIVLGAALVLFAYPSKDEEEALLARYQAEDTLQTTVK